MHPNRRQFAASIAAASVLPTALRAEEDPIDINWRDLIPRGSADRLQALTQPGIVQHGQITSKPEPQTDADLTTEFNGQRVRLPGYLVPLDFDGTNVIVGLLVPYVGACIHVPPPPRNQLVLINIETPYESRDLFDPVYVTGVFGVAGTTTQLAEVGYALTADVVEPYG